MAVEDWAEIRRLHRAEGLPIKLIARTLGISRNTVRAALASDGPPKYERKPAGTAVDAFDDAIRAQLTAVQQGTVNGGGGITHAVYSGPTGSQSDPAVAFVFKQLGCPYSYGSAGPCSVGFDCSGLVSQAWAAAVRLSGMSGARREAEIAAIDKATAGVAYEIAHPGLMLSATLDVVRLREWRSVSKIIAVLGAVPIPA